MAVYESMRLYIAPDKFYVEPQNSGVSELMVIDRISQEITIQDNHGQIPASAVSKDIVGLFGVIRLLAGPYLVVITKKTKSGEINGHAIWKVTGTQIHGYKRSTFHLNEQQIQENKSYLSRVEHILAMDSFYFSSTYDLTHTMQRLHNTSPDFTQMPLLERADPRFVWNGHLLREFAPQPELSNYCLPIMLGFVEIKQCAINGKPFSYILVSRRSCFRAGTRYYMRGLDSEGHAANFVETEQIIECEGNKSSFVQTRGSVPMYWSQRPNLKYKPDPLIAHGSNHLDGFQRHFAAQIFNYGKQVLINLLDQKGKEDMLVKGFAQNVHKSQNADIRYEAFDFHHECRKMRWDRLSLLLDRLNDSSESFGYFMVPKDGSFLMTQDGVFRTNCIDCLDRTNVVQSLLARRSLQDQFRKLELMNDTERIEDQTHFEYIFKNVWADNADACAVQYAGTGALKTDFTRTGKRTKIGLLRDGYNSAIRYVKNNFSDGFRQDAIDLFLGNYVVEEGEGITRDSPLRLVRDWKFYALPVIFLVAFSMCVISVLVPDEHPSEQFMYMLFWGGASAVTLGVMYYYGMEFVDKPKLTQAKTKME